MVVRLRALLRGLVTLGADRSFVWDAPISVLARTADRRGEEAVAPPDIWSLEELRSLSDEQLHSLLEAEAGSDPQLQALGQQGASAWRDPRARPLLSTHKRRRDACNTATAAPTAPRRHPHSD